MEMPILKLQLAIKQELLRMLARQLDYAPTADELPFTVQVMTDDLVNRGLRDADVPRLREAFARLGPALQKWPTARTVIEALPPPHKDMIYRPMLSAPSTALDRFVEEYLRANPHASKRDACINYLKQKNQLKNLPKSLQEIESEIEAAAERAAIQSESQSSTGNK